VLGGLLVAGLVALVAARRLRWDTAAVYAAVALIVAIPMMMQWYVAWLVPFAGLTPSRYARLAAVLLIVYLTVIRFTFLGLGFSLT
ncbi:MAG: hypothetical protein J2O48_07710, partial [Solirubrobacterales bacterium]|nr:hypothetical protein [Solirubrobacterales bacterium]